MLPDILSDRTGGGRGTRPAVQHGFDSWLLLMESGRPQRLLTSVQGLQLGAIAFIKHAAMSSVEEPSMTGSTQNHVDLLPLCSVCAPPLLHVQQTAHLRCRRPTPAAPPSLAAAPPPEWNLGSF